MDILIKNMEMPKSCEGCFACEEFSYECYDYCNILKAPTTRGERRKDCPLVALPSHGDLIDRNELPIIGITDYKLESHTVVEFEDVQDAPVIVEATE